MPRCGRNHERNNDQQPSKVLTHASRDFMETIAIFVTGTLRVALRLIDGLVAVAPFRPAAIDVTLRVIRVQHALGFY